MVDTYAWCLLGNHFHMLVRVREPSALALTALTTFQKLSNFNDDPTQTFANLNEGKSAHDIVSHQFRKFFQSYAMAFNKQQERIGTLFQTPFKRALITNDAYFTQLVYYIHANPQHHGLISDFRDWRWSSYNTILSDKNTKLKKQEVLTWFGNKDNYHKCHADYQKILTDEKLTLDGD